MDYVLCVDSECVELLPLVIFYSVLIFSLGLMTGCWLALRRGIRS